MSAVREVEQHACPATRPADLRVAAFETTHAGREWFVLAEPSGEQLVRVRFCPWCGAAL